MTIQKLILKTTHQKSCRLNLNVETLKKAALHGGRRSLTANQLIVRLIEVAINSDMVDAILDDEDECIPDPSKSARRPTI